MGLNAGPVAARVDAEVKAGLLALVDHAGEAGWSSGRSCALLGLDAERVRRWRARAATGRLEDARPGGCVHGLLPLEREAIVALAEP